MRTLVAISFCISCAMPAHSESLLDKIQSGAESAVDAVAKGTESAGKVIEKGADAVDDSLDRTNELMRDEETPEQTREKLDAMERNVLAQLLSENKDALETLGSSAGYAVFDMRRVSIFPLTAGYGRGVAVSSDEGDRTYMQMGTGGVGAAFGIGGFESQFVIMFETPADFTRFVENGYDASADSGVMSGEDRSSETIQFTDGRSIFVLSKTGWRVNANATGTKYWPDEDLN